jgi:hypothetical protein
VKSQSKKLDNSRHGYEQHPGASKTPGAFGREQPPGGEDIESPASDREEEGT